MRPCPTLDLLAADYDIAVVGAGPAGIAAARTAAEHGARVLLADLGAAPGGQIWRGAATAPAERLAALGPDYARGAAEIAALAGLPIDHAPETAVWFLAGTGQDGAPPDRQQLGLRARGATRLVTARQTILATGAQERPMPLPGWTEPGVMTAGAGQILLKASGLVPRGRTVLVGSGPLLWLLAAQYLALGHRPELMVDTTPAGRMTRPAADLGAFLASGYAAKGLRLMAKVRAKVPVIRAAREVEITREADALAVSWQGRRGRAQCRGDLVLLHQGVIPNMALTRAAGCATRWDAAQACFAPGVGATGETDRPGIRIAGDGAGIEGAAAALASGRQAALAAARDLGLISASAARAPLAEAAQMRRGARRGRAFLNRVYTPEPAARRAQGATLACRCEEVPAARIEALLAEVPVAGPNQLKAFTRCGMGPCQGRMCGPGITETIAAHRGLPPETVGSYRLRPPVLPVTLGEMAALECANAAPEGK